MLLYNMSAFAIPICYGTFGEKSRNLNKNLIEDIKHYIDNYDNEKRSGVDVIQTHLGLEKNYTSFELLSGLITKYVEKYIDWSGVKDNTIKVKDLWANYNSDAFAFHMPHSHGTKNSMFTGVYFPSSGILNDKNISDDENLDDEPIINSKSHPNPGDLVLLDPMEYIKTSLATKNTSKYPFFGNPICVTPKEGTIVVFPSYLSHMVTPTKKYNFVRMSIAFNIEI